MSSGEVPFDPSLASEENIPDKNQERDEFDKFFAVDPEKDLDKIKDFMSRLRVDGRIGESHDYKRDKESGELRYSDEQIAAQQWSEEDLRLVLEKVRQEKVEGCFDSIASRCERGGEIRDSIVRLDQEAAIAADLDAGIPVLIRGTTRIGKSSMLMSLITHRYGEENSIFIDARHVLANAIEGKEVNIDRFKKGFGHMDVYHLIAKREGIDDQEGGRDLYERMERSGKTPLEYLNDYLVSRGETVFLAVDEVTPLAGKPHGEEMMGYVTELKDLKNLKVAAVLHKRATGSQLEHDFSKIFDGYRTYFIRPLSLEETSLLVREPLEGTPINFTDEAVQEIFEFTGGRPIEIHELCFALMYKYSKFKTYRIDYGADDIKGLTGRNLEELGYRSYADRVDWYSRIREYSMNEQEKEFIDRLAEQDQIPVSKVDEKLVQPLIEIAFVRRDEQAGAYRINGTLLKRVMADKDYRRRILRRYQR